MKSRISLLLTVVSIIVFAQTGNLNINVYDEFSKKPLSAEIKVQPSGSAFSGIGNIFVSELQSGNYSLEITSDGYETGFLKDINVVPNQNLTFSIGLNKIAKNIDEVIITKKQYKTTAESPLSLRNITSEEVQKMQVRREMFRKQF